MKQLRAPTRKPIVMQPVWPNVGVQMWYQHSLDIGIDRAAAELLSQVSHAWNKTPPIFGTGHITAAYGDSAFLHAAGVIFLSGDEVLVMRRTDGEGWAFPGGSIEDNETAEAAARREAFEETLFPHNGPLEFIHTQQHNDVRFATFLAEVLEPFEPRFVAEHSAYRWLPIERALKLPLHPGARATLHVLRKLRTPLAMDGRGITVVPAHMVYTDADYDAEGFTIYGRGTWVPDKYILAMDAPSPTKRLQIALQRWGSQTIKRFDLMSRRIADDFAKRNARATQTSVISQLKKAGFTVKFKPTIKSMETFRVVIAENIALIKSIGRKYHADVEQKVWNAVRNGSDLHELSTELRQVHKITTRRAALIARDQNAKAKAVIERVRQQELGIKRGIWMHSHAGKVPRPTHVAQNNKPYSIVKGFYDTDEGEWVHPGQLINCRCTMRPVIEGFED